MADETGYRYTLAPGVTQKDIAELLEVSTEQAFRASGLGSYRGAVQTITSQFDRFGGIHMMPNTEKAGLTFITRPKLNLTTQSLRQHTVMATMDTEDPQSLPFSIRCQLDTNFAGLISESAATLSPFVNNESPFIIPLTNTLQSITGWPDIVLDTETTEGGFYSEDQTFVKGFDFLNRSYDLTLTFRDIQGGYVMALLLYWMYWIGLVTRGLVTAYPEDIAARRLCYTCSIYRFVLDPSMRTVVKYAKATGCFPKSLPIGNSFNVAEREAFLSSNLMFSIPFQVNHVEYMDPMTLADFNTLVDRFKPDRSGLVKTSMIAEHNFTGLPRINPTNNELEWWAYPEELENAIDSTLDDIRNRVTRRLADSERVALPPRL